MADIDDRDLRLVAQPLDIGQDLGLARVVERGQRLVHQDQLRAGEQRAADRDALLLAARQQAGPAVEQMADAEQVDDARPCRRSARRAARTSGRSADSGRPSYAGTAARPGRHSRCGACASARRCRAAVSTSTRPSTAMRPSSGRISPAMRLTSEVLPEPDGPNSAVSRPPLSKRGVEREARPADGGCRPTALIRCPSAGRRGAPALPRRSAPPWRWRSRSASAAARRRRRRAPA